MTNQELNELWALASDPETPESVRRSMWGTIHAYERRVEAEQIELARMDAVWRSQEIAACEAERRRLARRPGQDEINRKTQETHERNAPVRLAALGRLGGMRGRRMWAYTEHKAGRSFADIGRELAIGRDRARQLVARAERELKNPRWRRTPAPRPDGSVGRPFDMGGPRDVWLEFFPSPDPRFDNMAPVVLDNSASVAG